MSHDFVPDEATPSVCATCQFPRPNRRHDTSALAPVQGGRPALAADATATSQAAAANVWPAIGTIRREILDVLVSLPETGATDDELEQHLERPHQTVSAQRRGLVNDGYLVEARRDDGVVRTRLTRTGSPAQVWTLSDVAKRVIPGG